MTSLKVGVRAISLASLRGICTRALMAYQATRSRTNRASSGAALISAAIRLNPVVVAVPSTYKRQRGSAWGIFQRNQCYSLFSERWFLICPMRPIWRFGCTYCRGVCATSLAKRAGSGEFVS